ncbi:MAG TPA: antibiotic biosynthesis monooxygenase [Sphingomonas sp.]|nr:antibiotic biosynthesis monooxygenase [Sphingomonas sp.]
MSGFTSSCRDAEAATSVVSVTRFRLKSIRFLPLFLLHANRAIDQVRSAEGFLGSALRRDPGRVFWTLSVWTSEGALHAYVTSGAHRGAMPRLNDWGIEVASARWQQEGATLPTWSVASARLGTEATPLGRIIGISPR